MDEIQNNVKGTPRTMATYALALGLFALAGSIAYLSFTLAQYRNDIPVILESVEQTADKIEPMLTEVTNIREAIPPVLKEVAEVRKQIPVILDEVAEVRKQVPPILDEVQLTREQMPTVLSEVESIRKELPRIEKMLDTSSGMVGLAVSESAAIRELTPQILAEVQATRLSIPPTLDRVDVLIGKAGKAGREASSGVVTGIFKGIITAPFVIVGNAGQSVFGMSKAQAKDIPEADMARLTAVSEEVLAMAEKGAFKEWKNDESGYSGKTTLESIEKNEGQDCRILRVEIWKKGKEKFNKKLRTCKNENGSWETVKE